MAAAAAGAAPSERAELLALARLAREVNHVSDMFVLVTKMAELHFEFNSEERNILVITFRGTFSPKIRQLRVISALAEGEDDDPVNAVCAVFYRDRLEAGMQAKCREALDILEEHLLPFSRVAENIALYTMMKGDAYWILAMLKKEKNKVVLVGKALAAYEDASKAAKRLPAAHHLRLAVDLNKTAFYFDVMEWAERILRATTVAKLALEKAGPKLASLDEESRKKSAEIMGLMEANLELWKKPMSPKSHDSLYLDEAGPSNSSGSPSPPPPVIPRSAGPPVATNEFISPGDWGYDIHDGLSHREIRSRKKTAQMKRGQLG